jgi:hypothetical protein
MEYVGICFNKYIRLIDSKAMWQSIGCSRIDSILLNANLYIFSWRGVVGNQLKETVVPTCALFLQDPARLPSF